MSDLLLVYITFDSVEQAKEIGKHLMNKRLCACINIFPNMESMFFWPAKSRAIDESKEVLLIAKTLESKFKDLETEIYKVHPYDVPCIIAIPTQHVGEKYYNWLKDELI